MRTIRKPNPSLISAATLIFLLLAGLVNRVIAQTCVSPPDGMIAWWPMDEEAGTTVQDAAGSNSGVHVGAPIHEVGEAGRALHFDGSRSFVAVKDSDLWAFGLSDFTIELWVNFATPGGGSIGNPSHVFISNDESPGTANKWFFALGGGFLNFHINGPGIGEQFFPLVPFSPQVGRWYHLAVRRANTVYTIFVDGEPVGSATNTLAVPNANALLDIGEAEGQFYMNGSLDEVTIYNRGLSDAELKSIFQAGSAGKCKPPKITTQILTAAQLGIPYTEILSAEFGTPPYAWSVVNGSLPLGIALDASGVLSGTPQKTGSFGFTASVVDAKGKSATALLSLEVSLIPPPPDIRINKTGNIPVPGRTIDYFIVVENAGNTTANNIEIDELLDPLAQFADPSSMSPPISKILGNTLVWNIDTLAPGKFQLLHYSVTIAPTVAIGSLVKGHVVEACDQCKNSDQCHFLPTLCAVDVPEIPTGIELSDLIDLIVHINDPTEICQTGELECAEICRERCPQASHDQNAQGPTDPNEKLVVAKRFVRPEQTLVYPIHFENVGTLAAQDVFVTDILDPGLDASTLSVITPVGASFDSSSRILQWSLLGINLPPGKAGNVLFAIKPRRDLASGTIIHNVASIKFESLSPLDTNQVETVIDTTSPSCVMDPLPSSTMTPTFPLSWSGIDAVGQINTYSILVSMNGGPYSTFIDKTTVNNMDFMGVAGNSYSFICIATDTADNTEIQDAIAETSIAVSQPFMISRGSLSPSRGSGEDEVTIDGTFTATGSPIDPRSGGVTVKLSGPEGDILILNFPEGDQNWKVGDGPAWTFQDPAKNRKLSIRFDLAKEIYRFTLKLKRVSLSNVTEGQIATSAVVSGRSLLNTQEWRWETARRRRLITP